MGDVFDSAGDLSAGAIIAILLIVIGPLVVAGVLFVTQQLGSSGKGTARRREKVALAAELVRANRVAWRGPAGGAQSARALPAEFDGLDVLSRAANHAVDGRRETEAGRGAVRTQSPRDSRRITYTVDLTDGSNADVVDVMVVMRDVADGRLLVQIDDEVFRTLAEQPAPRRRFLKIIRELESLIKQAPHRGVEAGTPQQHTPAPDRAHAAPPADTPAQPRARPQPASIGEEQPPRGALPGDLPTFESVAPVEKGFRLRPPPPAQKVSELDIAGAIEQYLQHRLVQTPQFADRAVHIRSAADGGVRIEVDGEFYEAVRDVPDSRVRDFLTMTIQEWQNRH